MSNLVRAGRLPRTARAAAPARPPSELRRTIGLLWRYAAGQHIPTFVGLFPADHPQFVILVKIDNPQGVYFGGLTAAPVTKAVL